MTNEPKPQDDAIEQVVLETQPMPKENKLPEEIQAALDLINAIRLKAQSEAQKMGEFGRENYLKAVRTAQEEVDKAEIFAPEKIEDAIKQLQGEVEKDWDKVVKQVSDLGDRLNDAAKSAWEKLTAPRSEDKSDS